MSEPDLTARHDRPVRPATSGRGDISGSSGAPLQPAVWPVLHYDDPAMALRFLVEAFGFSEAIAVRDEAGDVMHAELRWPEGGAVVLGSTKHVDGVHGRMRPGAGACYVATDDVDGVHRGALRASAEILEPPHETAFGSGVATRAFTARDPEGNLWTFGSYRGAP